MSDGTVPSLKIRHLSFDWDDEDDWEPKIEDSTAHESDGALLPKPIRDTGEKSKRVVRCVEVDDPVAVTDPLAMLTSQRASRQKSQNAARVSKDGAPLFLKLPFRVQAHPDLSDGAKILYAYLRNVGSKDKKGTVWPYQATLAEALHVDVRTIRRYLSELQDVFLLTVEPRGMEIVHLPFARFMDR